jgi:hypothetical protein
MVRDGGPLRSHLAWLVVLYAVLYHYLYHYLHCTLHRYSELQRGRLQYACGFLGTDGPPFDAFQGSGPPEFPPARVLNGMIHAGAS